MREGGRGGGREREREEGERKRDRFLDRKARKGLSGEEAFEKWM